MPMQITFGKSLIRPMCSPAPNPNPNPNPMCSPVPPCLPSWVSCDMFSFTLTSSLICTYPIRRSSSDWSGQNHTKLLPDLVERTFPNLPHQKAYMCAIYIYIYI